MNEDFKSPLGEGLVYEDQVPLRWSKINAQISTSRLARIHRQNEEMLRFIAVLEEHSAETTDEDPGPHLQELNRMEYKINLLLDMVGQLLVRQTDMPQTVPIRLSSGSVQWHAEQAPALGEHLLLDIYIDSKYPSPLVFPGYVREVEPLNNEFRIVVEFESTTAALANALEKMIFRQHRRHIAYAKKSQPAGDA